MTPTRKFHRTMLITLLSIGVLCLGSPSTAVAGGPHDVRPGMTIEEATRVAIYCIQAASRMKTRDIRLQDTLAFVGINDEMRLDALRRHIVRNPHLGVGSITRPFNGHNLPYLILNRTLLEIDTGTTVAKLAQTIAKNAGLARLTYARTAQIIAKCRGNTKPLPTDKTGVAADLQNGLDRFVNCMVNKDDNGVARVKDPTGIPSAGVNDPTGKGFRYEIDSSWLRAGIREGLWSYRDLIVKIADTAEAPGLARDFGQR